MEILIFLYTVMDHGRLMINALAHMKALESFEFLYSIITLQRSLSYLKDGVVKIQGKDKDIVSGVSIIMESCSELKKLREDVDSYSQRIFSHSSRIAEVSNIPVTLPRISSRQQHRSNPEHNSVEDYFKKSIAIPFLDHLVSDISTDQDSSFDSRVNAKEYYIILIL